MKSILVVDDEFDLQQSICAALELAGYRTFAAGNGRDALEQLKASPPDLLISDVMMPGMSGYELVASVRRLPALRKLPVLLMSSIDPDLHPAGTWNAQMRKPFTLDRLLEHVKDLIGPGDKA